MIKVMRIDAEGFFIEDVLLEDGQEVSADCIADSTGIEGLHLPKWDGEKWAEGKPQSEIDAIKNAPVPKTELELMQDTQAQVVLALVVGGLM